MNPDISEPKGLTINQSVGHRLSQTRPTAQTCRRHWVQFDHHACTSQKCDTSLTLHLLCNDGTCSAVYSYCCHEIIT